MQKIKVAIVGGGYWGQNLIRNFWEVDEAELTFVCDLESKGNFKRSIGDSGTAFARTALVRTSFIEPPENDCVSRARRRTQAQLRNRSDDGRG